MTIRLAQDVEAREAKGRCRPDRLSPDEVVGILAHDLRSPLGAIQNALSILQLVRPPDPVVEQAVGVMDRQIGRLGRLIGDMLDLTRAATGKLELRQEWLDLATIVSEAVEACRPVIDQNGHQLTVFLPGEPVRLRADPARVQQILVNLLTNAAKYTDPGGRIGVMAEAPAGGLVVRVRDNGMGIPADLLPHIFDLFQQGPAAKNRGRDGLGVGLALVRWMVELHGGSITAQSDGLGKGAEFVVRLPAPSALFLEKPPLALAPPHWHRAVS
jgi:signal transduction histidine kinase